MNYRNLVQSSIVKIHIKRQGSAEYKTEKSLGYAPKVNNGLVIAKRVDLFWKRWSITIENIGASVGRAGSLEDAVGYLFALADLLDWQSFTDIDKIGEYKQNITPEIRKQVQDAVHRYGIAL